jgi:hypothetical protein
MHGFEVDTFLLSIKQRYPRSKEKRLNKGMAVHPRQPMMDRIKRGNEKHVDITAPIMQRSDHVHSRIASWVQLFVQHCFVVRRLGPWKGRSMDRDARRVA